VWAEGYADAGKLCSSPEGRLLSLCNSGAGGSPTGGVKEVISCP